MGNTGTPSPTGAPAKAGRKADKNAKGGAAPRTNPPGPGAPSRPPPEGTPGGPPVDPRNAESEDLKGRLARARADYDNLQKRVEREAAMERERQKARVLESFLPILELAHMAAHQAEAHPGPVSEGVILLAREFDRLVQREGLVRTGAIGERVDPARHDIVATEDAPGVAPGVITRVVQPGYLLGDKVLRFAKVCAARPGP
ncbi:MAG: nucleotide exchange factor GrpE [bacterium]